MILSNFWLTQSFQPSPVHQELSENNCRLYLSPFHVIGDVRKCKSFSGRSSYHQNKTLAQCQTIVDMFKHICFKVLSSADDHVSRVLNTMDLCWITITMHCWSRKPCSQYEWMYVSGLVKRHLYKNTKCTNKDENSCSPHPPPCLEGYLVPSERYPAITIKWSPPLHRNEANKNKLSRIYAINKATTIYVIIFKYCQRHNGPRV